jgi:hypothetical protein
MIILNLNTFEKILSKGYYIISHPIRKHIVPVCLFIDDANLDHLGVILQFSPLQLIDNLYDYNLSPITYYSVV